MRAPDHTGPADGSQKDSSGQYHITELHGETVMNDHKTDSKMHNVLHAISAAVTLMTASVANAADLMPVKAPPLAPTPEATGYVELYTGWAQSKLSTLGCVVDEGCETFSQRLDGWALGGAGRANYWWASNASLQLDAQAEGTSYRFSDGSGHTSTHSYLIGAHLSWRDPQRGLLGVFGGAGDISSQPFNISASVRHGLIGGEGQLYSGALTLYGQVGYDSTVGNLFPGVDGFHAWFLRGSARYYFAPNLRLEGTVLYANGSYDQSFLTSIDFKIWLWRAKAEYKFANSPFAIFAAYEGSRTTTNFAASEAFINQRVTDNRIMAGMRLYLGEKTLQWNDTMGATLDIISPVAAPSFMFQGTSGL